VYTGKGDKGVTDTATGERVIKSNPIIEWEGTLDELISQLGVSWAECEYNDIKNDIYQVQRDLFTIGEHILTNGEGRKLRDDGVKWLEDKIHEYMKEIGEIRLFVIPGGKKSAASLQLSRAVTRRAERRLADLSLQKKIEPLIMQYMNRLSSFLFFLSLAANKRAGFKERLFEWPNPEKLQKK
jgi:ATP:cob(I)alamin adenosyltransferase